jgi:hypothetical protein
MEFEYIIGPMQLIGIAFNKTDFLDSVLGWILNVKKLCSDHKKYICL